MAQNIYDQPEFFAGYSQLPRSLHGLDSAAEWPASRSLLPNLDGKRVVDLGCGFGWFARWARKRGAAHVLGLDLSENMIAQAMVDTDDPAIEYVLPTSNMSPCPRHRAISPTALSFSTTSTISTGWCRRSSAPWFQTRTSYLRLSILSTWPDVPGLVGRQGRSQDVVRQPLFFGGSAYDSLAKGVVKQHRTIGTTLNTVIGAGFTVRHVREWASSADQIAANPDLAEELERPMILIISVQA